MEANTADFILTGGKSKKAGFTALWRYSLFLLFISGRSLVVVKNNWLVANPEDTDIPKDAAKANFF